MPTIVTHTAVPLAIGLGLGPRVISLRLLLVGVLASILPDCDVAGFHLGVAYSDPAGHRGIFHSLAFAGVIALVATALAPWLKTTRWTALAFVLPAAASHGFLDMMTNGGLGVACFWPFTDTRYFLPWRVIKVSPLSLHRLASPNGRLVMMSELRLVWLPAAALCLSMIGLRRAWPRVASTAATTTRPEV